MQILWNSMAFYGNCLFRTTDQWRWVSSLYTQHWLLCSYMILWLKTEITIRYKLEEEVSPSRDDEVFFSFDKFIKKSSENECFSHSDYILPLKNEEPLSIFTVHSNKTSCVTVHVYHIYYWRHILFPMYIETYYFKERKILEIRRLQWKLDLL